ncbi:MAG TPA: hypothetical protein H9823_07105 [Candidatus Rubneribacter avistercoris]|nr:hypothetical protein [Candidatus Rubneribacter avistercoris]
MYTSTLTKTGNSESIAIPKGLRERLGVSASEPVELDSPRENVVVVYFKRDDQARRLERLEKAEQSNAELSRGKTWPLGATAEDMVSAARKEGRIHGDYPL